MENDQTETKRTAVKWAALVVAVACGVLQGEEPYIKMNSWVDTMAATHAALAPLRRGSGGAFNTAAQNAWTRMHEDFPVECDWVDQRESNPGFPSLFSKDSTRDQMLRDLRAFYTASVKRRQTVLAPFRAAGGKLVFTKHYNLGGSHYAYTEGLSDAQAERHFSPGTELCLLELTGVFARVTTLIEDKNGVIRDPDVSYDGTRVLFSWKKSDRQDDYHLYEMDLVSRKVRQLTAGLGYADYEGAYLPDGTIIFNSTRCVQIVDCWWTEVSNLYACDKDGKNIRRIGFDQVHSNYPQVLEDGRVVYTRWDYNDRGQIYPQPLFQMNPDGTAQTEFYGNNSWFPTTIMHARGIPGTPTVVAIISGHHCGQQGKLGIVDPTRGRQEAAGVQLIAPERITEPVRVDSYGQDGELFQYPFALDTNNFIVGFARAGAAKFELCVVTRDGTREVLVSDPRISCSQPVLVRTRPAPHLRPSTVDNSRTTGVYYVHDVYRGPSLQGVARGTIAKVRVVALEYRAAGIGSTSSGGPAGGAMISTPIAVGNGSWDVKRVLGEAPVYADGSACFTVPARTPLYFQMVDTNGCVAQTMRSWSTLMPGERFACIGCHEYKQEAPAGEFTIALKAGPKPLRPFRGPARGFSFAREVQPILDARCIRCHNGKDKAMDLRDTPVNDGGSKRVWSASYLNLTQANNRERSAVGNCNGSYVRWISTQSEPSMLPPYTSGSAKSPLIAMLAGKHKNVVLAPGELDVLKCWIDLAVPFCGDYTEAHAWSQEEQQKYARLLAKRKAGTGEVRP